MSLVHPTSELFVQHSRLTPKRLRTRHKYLGAPQHLSESTLWVFAVCSIFLCGAAVGLLGWAVGFAALIGVVVAYGVLRHPPLGGFLVAALVPITSGLNRGFPVPGLRLSELIVGALAVLVLVPALRSHTNKWNAVDWTSFIYSLSMIVFAVAHLAVSDEELSVGVLSPMLLPLQFFLIYRVVRVCVPRREQRDQAIRLVLIASLFVDALAIFQQLNIGPARDLASTLTAAEALESYGYSFSARATGPFQHWHPLAGYLVVIILLTVALLADKTQRVMSNKALIAVLAGALSALALSVTFVAVFGVVAGALYLGYRAGKLREALMATAGATVLGALAFGSFFTSRLDSQYSTATGRTRDSLLPQTVDYRFDVWLNQYIPSLSGRWLAGHGPTLPEDAVWSHTESVYITLALRGGLPLLVLFAASMYAVHLFAKRVEADSSRTPLARALVALVGVLWIMHFLFPYFTSSGMPQPFWVLAGICFAGVGVNSWKDSRDGVAAGRL